MTILQTLDALIALAKRRGFVFPGSEIYGGMAGIYDFGPYGVALLNNIKASWWRETVGRREDYVGLDSALFKDPRVWEASGHVGGFADPLTECRTCNTRLRVDKELERVGVTADEKMSETELDTLFRQHQAEIRCPKCGGNDFTPVKSFNLLVRSNLGDFTGEADCPVYLPGEACQGIYLNFKNVVNATRMKVPFGIAQIGKAFRNEISPRNFLFRTREFEQADTQYFVRPHENKEAYERIKSERWQWYLSLGIREEHLRWKQHERLVFYAKDAWDIEYKFPTGFDEVEGVHDRSDYDLSQHMQYSGTDLRYTDPETGEKYIPWILETSMGVGRVFLAVLCEAYAEDELGGEPRTVLRLPAHLAPVTAAVFPLLRNKPELVARAREIFENLKPEFAVEWDDNGNIGKRYRRQDEIGTPVCITVDFQTLDDGTVTVRDRDTGAQERIATTALASRLRTH